MAERRQNLMATKRSKQTKLTKPVSIEPLESRVLFHAGHDHGTGLLGQYFDNKDFTNLKLTRTDPAINFAWGTASPAAGIAPDTFAVRWSGQLVAPATGAYTFSTTTDDGVRLWVNGKLVIDKLINQPQRSYVSAAVPLLAGEAVEIRMDYFDNTGSATAKLMWSSPAMPKQVIAQEHLYPGEVPPAPPPPPPTVPTTPTTPTTPAPGASTVRIDAAGAKSFLDADGKLWLADKYYSGGSSSLGLFDIAGTQDDVMYATRRFGKTFSYAIPVAAGDYKVSLRFADASFDAGGRTFNVTGEGKALLNNFDIVAAAGGKGVAVTKSFNLTVTDGTLNLAFLGTLGNATLSAIEVVPAVAGPEIDWKTVAPSPVSRAEAMGAVVNGKLYVLGGFMSLSDGTTLAQTRCDVYDPATDTWTRLADEPTAITHAGVVVDGSMIYLIGGYVGNHPGEGTTLVHRYDTATDTWSLAASLPEARGAGSAAILDRKIHFFGGMNGARTQDQAEHWVLDLNDPAATWTAAAPLANARNHTAAVALNGKIYCVGGQHSQEAAQDAQREVNCYDPATGTWTRVADLPVVRSHTNASTFVMDGRIIVLGGESGYNLPQSTIYAYDPALNTWSLIGLLPGNRSTSVAGVIAPNQIISSTGNTPNASTTTWIGTLPTPPAPPAPPEPPEPPEPPPPSFEPPGSDELASASVSSLVPSWAQPSTKTTAGTSTARAMRVPIVHLVMNCLSYPRVPYAGPAWAIVAEPAATAEDSSTNLARLSPAEENGVD